MMMMMRENPLPSAVMLRLLAFFRSDACVVYSFVFKAFVGNRSSSIQ
jgi:hypothetical protein